MEITANAIQTVAANQNVQFTDVAVSGSCSIVHRGGSGIVTLRGLGQQTRARFHVWFGGNVTLAEGAEIEPVQFAISIGGEAIPTTQMIATPAAIGDYFNISASIFLDVPCGCCQNISIKNTGLTAADIQNANLIVERVA